MTTPFSDSVEALMRAAQEALAAGRFEDASELFARRLAVDPRDMQSLCGLSAARYGVGDFRAALETAKRASGVAPRSVHPLLFVAAPALILGDDLAIAFCFDVLKKADRELGVKLLAYWTQRLIERDHFDEAAAAYAIFVSSHPADYDVLMAYADLLAGAGRPVDAIKAAERAQLLRADAAAPLALRARAEVQLGNIDDGRDLALAAIGRDNDCLPAHFVLADVSPAAMTDAMLDRLARRLDDTELGDEVRALAGSSLGRALEARGAYDAAFAAFSAGNVCARRANQAKGFVYDRTKAEAAVRAAAEQFPRSLLATPAAFPQRGGDLIFIVGLARSGSTLIDQILSSHSQATSAGESMSLARVMYAIMARQAQSGEPIGALIDRYADEWEEQYRAGLKLVSGPAPFIIDKSLQNFWHCGLIARLFPAAKIIEMHRDPMDVGLSIYRLLFFGAHVYANDLGDIAHYGKCFEAMSGYWASALPRPIYRLCYEDFVADFEAQLSALLGYCGLAEEDACRRFERSKRAVFTLSAAQVRGGLDRKRSGSWRAYEAHLQPLRRALDAIDVPVPAGV